MNRIVALPLCCAFFFALPPCPFSAGETWPGFRGPSGQGVTDEAGLPLTWGGPTNAHVLWKSPLPGAADDVRRDFNQASPIVWKDRVFVTMVFWPKGVDQKGFPEQHVACYSALDGQQLWDVQIPPGPWKLTDLRGGYGAPTPATDGERVYVMFGSSVIAAVDFTGKIVWRQEIIPYAWDVAIGTSPILYQETVLVLADGAKSDQSRLIAFDRKTGEVAWEKPRPTASFSHSTPLLIEVNQKPQLVVASSSELQGLEPTSGNVIWSARIKGDVPTPAFGAGVVYTEDGRGGAGAAVDPTGMGDVTETLLKWKSKSIPEGYSSPTIAGEYVYRSHNPGVLNCLKLSTGEVVYSGRLPPGLDLATSPLLTPENNLVFASGGKSIVVPTGPKFEIIANSDLGDSSPASPAVANGRLYIKGGKNLYCIGRKK